MSVHPRDAIHLVFADEFVKPNDLAPTASIDERITAEDYDIIDLETLVRMKLTSYRDKDRTQLRDMIAIGLIGSGWGSYVTYTNLS